MFSNFFKNLSKALNSYRSQIKEVELSVLNEHHRFIEIYERNIVLEQEILERTEELKRANKGILALSSILDNVNSTEPLSGVLNTVVEGLVKDMGYCHACIWQVSTNEQGQEVLKPRAHSDSEIRKAMVIDLNIKIDEGEVFLENNENSMVKSVRENKMLLAKSFKSLVKGMENIVSSKQLEELDKILAGRTLRIIPLVAYDKIFGCMVVVSVRSDITDTEKNFLDLFVNQTEVAVTIAELFEKVREQAVTDSLTGLYNRRYFDNALEKEAERALRQGQPFTLISLDLDYLKKINDTLGHSLGDEAIKAIGEILRRNARSIDIPARLGGEEFSVILPGVDIDDGLSVAERLRKAIENREIDGLDKITASIGVATFLRHADNVKDLITMADEAMYIAKRKGRNQVRSADKEYKEAWQTRALETFIDILSKDNIPIRNDMAENILQKLNSFNKEEEEHASDLLYYVVDSLTFTYNPLYKNGTTRDKVGTAMNLAKKLKLPKAEVDKIKLAMLLYDIGNIMLPENILTKPGPLDETEHKKILEHPIIAAKDILKPIKSAHDIIALVEHHHESWDGSGYPYNLSGNQIPIGSRIILIVDSYFAMISDRPYRPALSKEEALKILKEGANSRWDGRLVEVFTEILQEKEAECGTI